MRAKELSKRLVGTWLVLLLAVSLIATGCPRPVEQVPEPEKAVPVRGGSLVVALPAEPPILDPTASPATAVDAVVYQNVIEGLLRVNREGEILPALATEWHVSPDGRVYTFHLRRGVKFHNGEPFNAQVAKWNIERAKMEGTKNPRPDQFRIIERIDTPDDYTLILTLEEPNALFLRWVAGEGHWGMLPMKGYEKAATEPIGTGPFKFVRWVRGDRVELTRFEGYWNPELPYLDKVTMRFIPDPAAQVAALKAGEVDVVAYLLAPELAVGLMDDERFNVLIGTSTTEVIVATNNKAEPFDCKLVRQAMAHAIDRQALIDMAQFGFGTPMGSHWQPGAPYYVDLTGIHPYNPERARELLAEAGYPDGFETTLQLPYAYAYTVSAGEVVADMLAKVGIDVEISLVDWGFWLERIFFGKEYELTIIGHAASWDIGIYANPDYYFQYDSQEFRDAYAKALKAPTEAERAKWFGRAQEIIARDAVNIFLYSAANITLSKAAVNGLWENYVTPMFDVTEVWWWSEYPRR
ncbi:ABC transporter substrate-binding protein [Dehalococcoidia bacterium]|nr:ABC transporter substrate-binding protein [Dehalococcoidia bacterium]